MPSRKEPEHLPQPDPEGLAGPSVSKAVAIDPPPLPGLLTALPLALRWLILLVLSLSVSCVLFFAHIPGALLLGPMVAAILVATNGARLSVHRTPYIFAHSLIGCIIARSIDLGTLTTVADDWPVFLSIVLAIIAASSLLGFLMAKARILPGTTAIWGTSAGAASAMVLMAEAHGGDPRLVAFMQYLRVAFVATGASLMAAFVFNIEGGAAHPVVWFPQTDWLDLGLTLAAAIAAALVGARLKLPAGTMLLPLVATTILHVTGFITLQLPEWLLALAYCVIGWRIGLSFTRRILRHAAGALPQIVGSILVLMAFSGGLAFLLWSLHGIDPLTAYLATSPGGLDSIAIIAATTPVDMSFIMALQTMRLILIILIGPPISDFVARHVTKG
ncbi:AbrB family transcriptional regulator [Rhizobium sp. AQ_MP]|uniref:AbrB family transcriptional regulator n=1 Tax=Rhizobium sp. AQ_MP TaxID=2761536 RepID=UPI001FEDBD10|nr:AbrB family transcriptional regulator [Rhizobium sp. AQ_MP]